MSSTNRQGAKKLIREWDELTDPKTRYVDLAIRFELADGTKKGIQTHCYGGTWDRDADSGRGCYANFWDRDRRLWQTRDKARYKKHSPLVTLSRLSDQSLHLVTDLWTRTTLALGGRRSGKSYGAAQKAVLLVLRFPGRPGLVVSPTYRQARNVFKHIYTIVPRKWLLPGKLGFRWSNEYKELRFVNGAIIYFRSAENPDSCRSDGAAWLLADELQDIGTEAYSNAHFSLSEGGDDYLITQTATIKPDFREHYEKLKALESNSIGLARVLRMRSRGNPFIGHALFDEATQFLDEQMVQREIEAQWPELVGRIYFPFKDEHVRSYPDHGLIDDTAEFLSARFGGRPAYDSRAPQWLISVDPPHHAAIWKHYTNDTLHLVHEILIGADGTGGDVRDLAKRVKGICGTGYVVQDPHDRHWDRDVYKYFRREGFRFASIGRRVHPEYRITSVRARLERGKLLVDPSCPHAIEVFSKHQYKQDGSGEVDKSTKYKTSHQRGSTSIQLVHLADAIGYGVYKLYPAKYDYEAGEKAAA